MKNRIAMQLWISSAHQHLAFVQNVREDEQVEKQGEDREALQAFLATLPEATLEDLINREDEYSMSVRVYNCLERAGVNTVAEIVNLEEAPRLILENAPSLEYLRKLLTAAKLSFPQWLNQEATS